MKIGERTSREMIPLYHLKWINLPLYIWGIGLLYEEYNYEIPCGTGEIVIGEEVYYGIKPEEKINNNAQKLINIECNVGDITVDFTGA